MAQVIIEVASAPLAQAGRGQVFSAVGHKVAEVTATGTAASAAASTAASLGDIVAVINTSTTSNVWVRFDGTAAVGAGHMVPAGTIREFGPLELGQIASVILDS